MSVLWALETAGNRDGHEQLTPARTWVTRNYQRHFNVLTDNWFDGPEVIGSSGAIPSILDPYIAGNDIDLAAVCTSRRYSQPNNRLPTFWHVTIEYEGQDDPLTRPHLIRTGKSVNNRVIWQDVYAGPRGQAIPITNSAGCYFDPPVMISENRPLFSIERNEPITSDPIALASFYGNCTNLDYFMGCAPNTVLCLGVTGADAFEAGIWYWNMNYEFQYRSDTWLYWAMDQGTMGLAPNVTPTTPNGVAMYNFVDANGSPISEPVPMDGKGGKLYPVTPATIVYLPYNVYVSVPFSPLGLP